LRILVNSFLGDSIDFINARICSAVNVMGDMQVAILLDAGSREPRAGVPD
jgi:hypothetical protein